MLFLELGLTLDLIVRSASVLYMSPWMSIIFSKTEKISLSACSTELKNK